MNSALPLLSLREQELEKQNSIGKRFQPKIVDSREILHFVKIKPDNRLWVMTLKCQATFDICKACLFKTCSLNDVLGFIREWQPEINTIFTEYTQILI